MTDLDIIIPIAAYIACALLVIGTVGYIATDESKFFKALMWTGATLLILLELALVFYDQYLQHITPKP